MYLFPTENTYLIQYHGILLPKDVATDQMDEEELDKIEVDNKAVDRIMI